MYATAQAMTLRFGEQELIQLTDQGRLGALDTAVLTAALDFANGVVDTHLSGGGYALPISKVSPVLVSAACSIARWALYDKKRPDAVNEEYDRQVAWLKLVSSGAVKLDVGAVEGAPAATSMAAPTRTLPFSGAAESAFTSLRVFP